MSSMTKAIVPKSHHTSDTALQPFLGPSFDPTAYLNSTLPSLFIASAASPSPVVNPRGSSTLTDLTSQAQSQLTQLSALSARLTATLTDLTDDILRSGARLAYDVELLRGEAVALTESLMEGLTTEIHELVPNGLSLEEDISNSKVPSRRDSRSKLVLTSVEENVQPEEAAISKEQNPPEPEALTRLRTLLHIRSQLQSVISTFDLALSWPLPPSATSTSASNFISVAAPSSDPPRSPGSTPESQEAIGKAAEQKIRASVTDLLALHNGADGVLKAEERMDQLRDLLTVWKGTSEEKYRTRFVDGLAKLVGDRRRDEEAKGSLAKRDIDVGQDNVTSEKERGKGLLGGLRRLRDEIYLD